MRVSFVFVAVQSTISSSRTSAGTRMPSVSKNGKSSSLHCCQNYISNHATFDRMIRTFKATKHQDAADFLRSNFLGVCGVFKKFSNDEDRRLATFLAAHGVKMSSPLINVVIRQCVIPGRPHNPSPQCEISRVNPWTLRRS
ncbi:hypothetical protein BC936DRAFT_144656 [Jimgerdemannia flammicorona]|uniref:Uncharacterized protein n=1 Tax=Jimgerdemannia flammicorona TaxID=994334 RepID=A0A433DC02_9FUNG|nr:hypothetical protein BC936DRAFT_144656 [Jimgerdemannia flammicorona]